MRRRISKTKFLEHKPYFFKINKYSCGRWRTWYGVTVLTIGIDGRHTGLPLHSPKNEDERLTDPLS
jgi:hypothetical protein